MDNYDKDRVLATIKEVKKEKDQHHQNILAEISNGADDKLKRTLALLQEKGAGAWLTARPMKSLDFELNKQNFSDAIRVRYDWRVPGTPSHCVCGAKNDIDHALNCKKGPYIIKRHNRVRDTLAEIMKEVCMDVKIEPSLLPLANTNMIKGNTAENARLDVSGIGVWSPMERTFLDIRVMHPNSPSYIKKEIKSLYQQHEKEKKRAYIERVTQVEKGSFTPFVMSTSGGMGTEAVLFVKRISELIAAKRNEDYSDVVNYIRTRLSFCMLKSVLLGVRGERGKKVVARHTSVPNLSFNLIQFD